MIHAQVLGYVTKVVMKTDLQNLPGQEAIFYVLESAVTISAAVACPPEGHEFVYVIEGEQTFEIEGICTRLLRPVR